MTVRKKDEDGSVKACAKHRVARKPTVGRRVTDTNGYVRIQVGGGRGFVYEHRWVWAQANGEIPAGYHVHHINENKADNRLGNLQLVLGRIHNRNHTAERHEDGSLDNRGKASVRYRLDLQDEDIVRRRDSGESFRSIGRDLGVGHNVIANHYRRTIERLGGARAA